MEQFLNLKPTRGTVKKLRTYMWDNKETMTPSQKILNTTFIDMVARELIKPSKSRATLTKLYQRAKGVDENMGADSVDSSYTKIK